jgi:hypothetical protein
MGLEESEIPYDLMKQDPSTGNYKLGSIEMTPAEYALTISLNNLIKDVQSIKERLIKVEGK